MKPILRRSLPGRFPTPNHSRLLLCLALLLPFAFSPLPCHAQGVITTVAGTDWVFRDEGRPGVDAPLGLVAGVAVDSAGNLYLTDVGNHRSFKVSADGTLTTIAGNGIQWFSGDGGPGANASVSNPWGVAVDAAGNVFVADSENQRVRRIGLDGTITTVAGGGDGPLGDGGPAPSATLNFQFSGVAVDANGNLYIADRFNHRVRMVTSISGIITTVAGTGTAGFSGDAGPATSAELEEPTGVAVDASGNIYIADRVNQRVRRVGPDGMITTVAGNGIDGFGGDSGPAVDAALNFPEGVAVDGSGNLYIADTQNHRVRMVSPGGTITTVAGSGTATFAGDGGPAASATLNAPTAVAVDAGGDLYIGDFENGRIRRVSSGTISTVAGNGLFKYGGDGAAATSAFLDQPFGVAAADSDGNFYIADTENHRIRKVTPDGIITTIAGTGIQGFSGDEGLATGAALSAPRAVALDTNGNLYIADTFNARIRRVNSNGIITTVAGGAPCCDLGDGGPATSAFIGLTFDVALDTAGNIYIADRQNERIRKVDTNGIITTLAGGGDDFPANGLPATRVALNSPDGVGVDTSGNIYIADRQNNLVHKVSPDGTLTIVAGTGEFGFSGDGGPATSATLLEPTRVAVDASGSIYISESFGDVRRVTPDGIINTFIGGSGEQFAGDGGPSNAAGISGPSAVAFDLAGNVYLADSGNDRIRKVLVAAAPTFTVSPASLTVSAASGAPAVAPQQIAVASTVSGLGWTAQAAAESGGDWLAVSPTSGLAPGVIAVNVDVANLAPGSYRGQVTVQAPLAVPATQTAAVELTVGSALPPELRVEPTSIGFETRVGAGNPPTETLRIENAGGSTLEWTLQAETASGGKWLTVSLTSGSASPGSPSVVQVNANVADLTAGVYSGSVRVDSPDTNQIETVSVTLLLTEVTQTILVSQSGLLFTGVEGGEVVPSQSFGILNTGQGAMSWTVEGSALAGGNWLIVSPTSGSSEAGSLEILLVEVGVNVGGLSAGQYSGLIRVEAPGANNTPQFVTVELNVLRTGSNPGVLVRPTGLIFSAPAGTSPGSQSVRLATPVPGSVEARSGLLTSDGGNWLRALPGNVAISPDEPRSITLQPFSDDLVPGVYRAALTLLFLDGSPTQVVNILLLAVESAATSASTHSADSGSGASQAQCVPQRLLAVHRSLGNNFASPVSWPSPIEVQVTNDCGNAVVDATVVGSFSSGDPPLALASLRNGSYVGTWRPVKSAARVTVTVRAERSGLAAAVVQAQGSVSGNPTAPALFAGGIVNGASFAPGGAVAPGSIVAVFGSNLAQGRNLAPRLPLETTLGGATLNVGGTDMPLFFSGDGQINAQLPFDLTPNSRPQVFVKARREGTGPEALAVPESITVATVQPGIFTINQQGTGQGAILDVQNRPVDAAAPAAAGEVVQVFCTGLGATDPQVAAGVAAPSAEPLARVVMPVQARVGGIPATVHFAGLAPDFAGLYQVNVEIPEGVEPGPEVPLVLVQNGVPSNPVTLAIR